jgi:hypothetical protein
MTFEQLHKLLTHSAGSAENTDLDFLVHDAVVFLLHLSQLTIGNSPFTIHNPPSTIVNCELSIDNCEWRAANWRS